MEGTHVGLAVKELNQTEYGANIVKGGATGDAGLSLNFGVEGE